MPKQRVSTALSLQIREGEFVTAQQMPVSIRAQSQAAADQVSACPLTLSVGKVIGAITLRAEPTIIRMYDEIDGEFLVAVDNTASNFPANLHMRAWEAEDVVTITPSTLNTEVGAGVTESIPVQIRAPMPDQNKDVTRELTVSASDDTRTAQTRITLKQGRSDLTPLWRTGLTMLGALCMMVGSLLPWSHGSARISGIEWTPSAVVGIFDRSLEGLNSTVNRFASLGAL